MQHNKEFIEAQARIFKALGHPSRLLMVDALRDGEKCVCDLQALVGDDMSTISKHLAVLRDAGVVTRRKQGVNIYYSLALYRPAAGKAHPEPDGHAAEQIGRPAAAGFFYPQIWQFCQ